MTQHFRWYPEDVQFVADRYPQLVEAVFREYGVRTLAERSSLCVGEVVKIILRTDANDDVSSLYRRWVAVQEVREGDPPLYVGALRYDTPIGIGRMPPDGSTTIEFGPEHVYRMEPRTFGLWGPSDIPMRLVGKGAVPCDEDGNVLVGWRKLMEIEACGWNAARSRYEQLATLHADWPPQLV